MGRLFAFIGGSILLRRVAAVAVIIAALAFVLALLGGVVVGVSSIGWLGVLYILGLLAGLIGVLTAATGKDATLARALTTFALLAFAIVAMSAPTVLR